jgi:HEAT repeat protein
VQALGDQEDDVCMEAMRFAFDNPDRKSTKPLVSYLGREDAKYRWKAVEVLGRIRDPEAAPVLLGLLQDETLDVQTRSRACGVLAMLGHKPAEPVIQKMAKQGSDSELTRVARESLKLFKEK